jgi:hypothetical protein
MSNVLTSCYDVYTSLSEALKEGVPFMIPPINPTTPCYPIPDRRTLKKIDQLPLDVQQALVEDMKRTFKYEQASDYRAELHAYVKRDLDTYGERN